MTEALETYLARLEAEIQGLRDLLEKAEERAEEVREIIAQSEANQVLIEALRSDLAQAWRGSG